ncbi:glycosyltransferase family 39 protein [Pseudonocardia ailaonensis]|uniref:Glycosyltransferase family 39 protein n=1 Tax=Pseudonocardia ailaonensis TaxID=367279 RepID=A0ABN2NKU5_9PSEU
MSRDGGLRRPGAGHPNPDPVVAGDSAPQPGLPPFARGPVLTVAALVTALLVALAGRYGYHRDELYFLAASRRLSVGYPDQGPVTPLIGWLGHAIFGDSLVGTRVLPALMIGATALLAGLMARELRGGRGAQALAAGTVAVSAIALQTGHLLSTTTFDLLAWALTSWLVVRALRRGGRSWLWVGLSAGIALENKMLMAFLLVALLVGLLLAGPRSALRDPWLWLGGLLALVLWAPWLVWQFAHGLPLLTLSGSIAAGGSTSSQPWWLVVPFQAVLVSPLLIPVWVAGLVALWRGRELRLFVVAYAVLLVIFTVTSAKPYYVCGLYPLLLAAGAGPTVEWARTRVRAVLLAAAVALGALVNVVLMLPVVPVTALASTPITDVVPDVGETVGWPEFARTVAGVVAAQPAGTVVVARNYGEAGAVERFAPGVPVFGTQNSLGYWGPPPESARQAVVIGFTPAQLERWFTGCTPAARIDNGVGLKNQEQGRVVSVCTPRGSWAELWPQIIYVG